MSKFQCSVCPSSFSSYLGLDRHYEGHIWIVEKRDSAETRHEDSGKDKYDQIGSSKCESDPMESRIEFDLEDHNSGLINWSSIKADKQT